MRLVAGAMCPCIIAIATLNYLLHNVLASLVDDLNAHGIVHVHPRISESIYRRRRDLNRNLYYEEDAKLKIVELEDWIIDLDTDHVLLANFDSEWIFDDRSVKECVKRCNYKTGRVRGHDSNSSAAVTICGSQITGFINSEFGSYFVEPIGGDSKLHAIYESSRRRKRSEVVFQREWKYFNMTGDTIDIGSDNKVAAPEISGNGARDDLVPGSNVTLWRREDGYSEDVGYFIDSAWESMVTRRKKLSHPASLSPPQWLEIALAVDYTVINFHGEQRVRQYVLSLMNIVNAIYQDPSLDANLHLVITRLFFYKTRKESVVRIGNSKRSLQKANMWNMRLHMALAPGEPRHDIAVWLTRSYIGGPSGYAPVSGVCDAKRSCSLIRDEGLTSAFIIAHEIAHMLGLSHDGEQTASNTCGGDAFQGSIMAPLILSTFHNFMWSDCSRREYQRTINNVTCLSNKPPGLGEIILNSTVQSTFTMDEQCRMEFGEGYSMCRTFDIIEACTHLWCGHEKSPLVCKTKKGPPLEGTECGFDKWCVNGYCEPVDKRRFGMDPVLHNPQDGKWSDWGPWGPCSRSCGTGVEFRIRKCDNPPPLYGGNHCFGLAEEWRVCDKGSCRQTRSDIRAQQCLRLPKYLNFGSSRNANMTWLPFESEEHGMKCKLICISKETRELYVTDDNLIDGSPCSYDRSEDICIQGICHKLGCDGKLFSSKKLDYCGVCGGNNSDCKIVKSVYRKKLKREVSRLTVIPRQARQIKIEANFSTTDLIDPSVAFMLKDRRKRSYSVTIPNTRAHTEILAGTKFYYKKFGREHNIWAMGPVLAEMVILLFASKSDVERGVGVSFRSQYFIHKDTSLSSRFKWILGGWGPCSRSCGGGRRSKTVACFDEQSKKLVPRKYCSLLNKPTLSSENCNVYSCEFHWVPGRWEPCSTTCGSYGIQSRELYCLPQSGSNENETIPDPWLFMVSPTKCGNSGLPQIRTCNRIPCPSYWEYGEWSQCSSSCGSGTSVRSSHCPPPNGEYFFSCGPSPPSQRRICRGPFTRRNNALCKGRKRKPCNGDRVDNCSLPYLAKYCKLIEFRRICCKTCMEASLLQIAE